MVTTTEPWKDHALEILTKRISEALMIYAAAVQQEEGDPDFEISMLPISIDVENGEIEVHYIDKLNRGFADGVFRVSVEFNE